MDWKHALRLTLANPRAVIRTALAYARGAGYHRLYRLRGQRVVVGRSFRVWGSLEIRGPGTVIFGDHCNVISSRLQPTTIFTHHPDAVIRFGDRVQLTGTRFGCDRSIEIGDMAGLSDARIMDTDFHALEVYDQPRYNTRGVCKPIVMERNVWIGAGAMVLKGGRVGENSVVAAGSVVAGNVPANAVVFGNPARVVWRLRGRPLTAPVETAPVAPPETPPVAPPETPPVAAGT